MDIVTRYIFVYLRHLLTEPELTAWGKIISDQKIQHIREAGRQEVADEIESGRIKRADVDRLLREGKEAFFRRTKERIIEEYAAQEVFNRCPICRAVCRTPRCRQCPKCYHTWHEIG